MTGDHSDARKLLLIKIDAWALTLCVVTIIGLAYMSGTGTPLPEIAWLTLGGLITHFGNGLLTAHNYDFGSSAGSRAKDLRPPTSAEPEPGKEN